MKPAERDGTTLVLQAVESSSSNISLPNYEWSQLSAVKSRFRVLKLAKQKPNETVQSMSKKAAYYSRINANIWSPDHGPLRCTGET